MVMLLPGPRVADCQRAGGHAVEDHTQQDGEGDRGNGRRDGAAVAELLDCQQREHDRGKTPRPEPADEEDCLPVESRPEQREGDRDTAGSR